MITTYGGGILVKYTKQAEAAIDIAKRKAKKLGVTYVGTEHLLVGLLGVGSGIASALLSKHGVALENVVNIVDTIVKKEGGIALELAGDMTPKAEQVLKVAQVKSAMAGAESTGTEHILIALLETKGTVAYRILKSLNVDFDKMLSELLALSNNFSKKAGEEDGNSKEFKATPNLLNNNFFDNMMGYNVSNGDDTPTLNEYGRDLTLEARSNRLDPVIGRSYEMERIIQILSRRTKNNPCLIGEPGVGKTAIVEGLAIAISKGEVPDCLLGKRIVMLDLTSTVAGSKYRGEFEERLKNIINEVTNSKDVLLFIDEIHTLIGAGSAEGSLDASNILKPSLARGEVQVIGATTIGEYRKRIEKDPALERRFQPVEVEEPTEEETVLLLKGIRKQYEEFHKVNITDDAIDAAVTLSARYINDRFLPDKAIDVIDEASAKVKLKPISMPKALINSCEKVESLKKEIADMLKSGYLDEISKTKKKLDRAQKKYDKLLDEWENDKNKSRGNVTETEICDVVSKWSKVPVSKLATTESKRLLKLENELHKRVIGQEDAIKAVSKAIRRGRLGIKDPKRPTGSFLFLGPTGVGKTELSKALAESVFGSEDSIIRVDMSEFMEGHSVSKLVGSPPGYVGFDEGGQLCEKVRRNPYSVVLFDEVEKAHPDVFNILLQVLDDGILTDSKGRKVSFKNTVIIMTSNAGAARIVEPKTLGFNAGEDEKRNYETMKSNVMEEVNRIFKPEFINRIDEIIVFHQLTKEEVKGIVNIMLKNVAKVVEDQLAITLKFTPKLKEFMLEKGYDKKYGARPMRRAIQTYIEDEISDAALKGEFIEGDVITCSIVDGKVTFAKK